MTVADLHCDLLWYLASFPEKNAYNIESNCSLSQLKEGGVRVQTFAVYTDTTSTSSFNAEKQFKIFSQLLKNHPNDLKHLKILSFPEDEPILHGILAIENASGLCSEDEELALCFSRLDHYIDEYRPLLYISLTWNHENRYGGGNKSLVGLKRDGELLLEYLNDKKIAIDLSHTSDALASDILNYIDKKNLKIIPIASHSNFRSVTPHERNLPDIYVKEIIRRGGIIGLNFVTAFIGKKFPDDFFHQIEYARDMGALSSFCLGADFFYEKNFISTLPVFYSEFGNSSCYPLFIHQMKSKFSQEEIDAITHRNFCKFLTRLQA